MNALRRLRRTVAKRTMKNNGMTKICKGGFFSRNWRYW